MTQDDELSSSEDASYSDNVIEDAPDALASMSDEEFENFEEKGLYEATPSSTEDYAEEAIEVEEPQALETEYEETAEHEETVDEISETEESEETHSEPVSETSESTVPEEFKRIFQPFKANGKTVQVDSPDDVVSLMQMGANYHKKMQDMKPYLKTVKMLRNHDLLDEQKLSLMIDASKGNTAAFKQLAKAANVDLDDLRTAYGEEDSAEEYQPNNYQLTDEEFELDDTVEELKTTDTYNKLTQVVSSDLDVKSREILKENPVILKTINEHIGSGLYNEISEKVSQLRMLGKVPSDLPDIEVYGRIYKGYQEAMVQGYAPPQQQQVQEAPVSNQNETRQRKKAMSKTRKSPAQQVVMDEEAILGMSDEAYEDLIARSPLKVLN